VRRAWRAPIGAAWVATIATCAALACGSVDDAGDVAAATPFEAGADAGTDGTDDATDATDASDGGADAGLCAWYTPFGTVTALEDLNSWDDEGTPRLTPDELTIYFDRSVAAESTLERDVFVAQRTAKSAPFDAPRLVYELRLPGVETAQSTLSPDQLNVIFSRRSVGVFADLFFAHRSAADASFDAPHPLAWANTDQANYDPYITHDGTELYFASNRVGQGASDIYVAPAIFAETSSAVPVLVAELASEYFANAPVLSADGLTIYFWSSRPSGSGIWVAHRASRGAAFGAPGFFGVNDGRPGWVSVDGCRLYFMRQGTRKSDLFVAERTP
jgi:hypothetical protein